MKKPTNPTVSFTCRLRVDVMELIRNLALQGKISQAAIITNALECMVNNHTNEIPHNALAELKMQILEKDQLINKLVSNQTELIRQNDQGQQHQQGSNSRHRYLQYQISKRSIVGPIKRSI